jgi:hypothetical protein
MNAFSAAIDVIFADQNVAADADWFTDGHMFAPRAIRVVARAPDTIRDFGQARLSQPGMTIDVRVSELPEPSEQDRVEIGGVLYQVQGDPQRDSRRLVWSIDLREIE